MNSSPLYLIQTVYVPIFPPDAYTITPINDTTFRIEMSNVIIIPQTTFIHNFEDYISLMPKWSSSLIFNFKTNSS